MSTTTCRECEHEVSFQAYQCPNCGAPEPYQPVWTGRGFEYKSDLCIGDMPLLHICFKYKGRRPRVARGFIAIGQFAVGMVTISQFGLGVVSVSQFTIAGLALAQFCIAGLAVAQIGLVWQGFGQLVFRLADRFPL